MGKAAAAHCAQILNAAIQSRGEARLVLSTGNSQIDTLRFLVRQNVDWSKVVMFHLDEYVGLPMDHPASFRRYLKEKFIDQVPLRRAVFVSPEGDLQQHIAELTVEIRKAPIDLALVGIGENAHIAFNDPPADFETREAFIVVNLDRRCKEQQVREGWFSAVEDVPAQAVSMTVHQILRSEAIISCVPYRVKAQAVAQTLNSPVSNYIPATALKTHPNVTLYLDDDSASLVNFETLASFEHVHSVERL
ncbi:glucosamine-6-phosphate deaminase [Alicyclobacillus macrosporangiidus]|uniref:glucosamine-6-phosphate deaminase n=1 Tax=Alicyclobacillus macrosporangiidus TaxID=392015 RepID=UPI0018CC244C|nr:glucosamine-6-phosphate deaminase [Alicyclobacillus macrosporangiidus]